MAASTTAAESEKRAEPGQGCAGYPAALNEFAACCGLLCCYLLLRLLQPRNYLRLLPAVAEDTTERSKPDSCGIEQTRIMKLDKAIKDG